VLGAVQRADDPDEPFHRSPNTLRHTFAAWTIVAGIGLLELSRLMGTSSEQIDRTSATDKERTANG
jgi:integrase